jgi:hypothetical protein
MSNKILFKRGIEANLPILDEGEPALASDKPFIGTSAGNKELATKSQLPNLLTASFTATVNATTNIIHNLSYDSAHDDLLVIYNGVLCDVGENYTENANKISINLVGWYINAGEVIKFKLYKNIK